MVPASGLIGELTREDVRLITIFNIPQQKHLAWYNLIASPTHVC